MQHIILIILLTQPFVSFSRTSSNHHLCYHQRPPARTQIQHHRLRAAGSGRVEPHSVHLTDYRWETSRFLPVGRLNSEQCNILSQSVLHRIFHHLFLHQHLTHLLCNLWMRFKRLPSKLAGPDLRLQLLVGN